jgi:hypothetical protein
MKKMNDTKDTLAGIGRGAGLATLAGALLGGVVGVLKDSDAFDPGPPFFEPL